MKDFLKIGAVFTILVIIIPMLSFISPIKKTSADDASAVYAVGQADDENSYEPAKTEPILNNTPDSFTESKAYDGSEEFSILDCTSNEIYKITMLDYVIGAVLAEMPASFHEEALKAQAVAAHTYAVRQMEKQLVLKDPELKGAYITNDSTKYQAYFTKEQAKSFYKDSYDESYSKVSKAVEEVIGKVLYYNGEPIVAAFHSASSGKTESAEIIWGNPIDYLIPVDSSFDESSPAYLEELSFTAEEIKARLSAEYSDIKLESTHSKWLSVEETSSSGTVTKLKAGNKIIEGTEFRVIFSLRSANFTIEYNKDTDKFTVTTKGYGHGVGLSQYGSNSMANDGMTYEEILLHYYTGAEISEYSPKS